MKLKADAKQVQKTRNLLAATGQEAETDRVWVKSMAYERWCRKYGAGDRSDDSRTRVVSDACEVMDDK
jgi:hypothetical protein